MRTRLLWCCLLLLGVASLASALTLVESGKSDYVIVTAAKPSPSVSWAASQLRTYIKEMSGAELRIQPYSAPLPSHCILLGKSKGWEEVAYKPDWQALGEEGFALKTEQGRLLIAGSDLRGAMYGAEEVLRKLGVRWYAPKATLVPRKTSLVLPDLDEIQRPDFSWRWPLFWEMNSNSEWCAHTRTNGPPGIKPEQGGFNPNFNGAENFYQIVPPSKYFKTHPEYFSLRNGKRDAARDSQLCLSNPDVLKLAIQYAIKYFEDHPKATTVGISPNDAGDGNCECANCLALDKKYGGPSGTELWFINQVADAVKAHFPHRKVYVMTLAYQYTEAPPKHIKPRDNVLICLCPIHCCEAHPYETDDVQVDKVFMKHLKGWAKIARGRLYIWHYNTNFRHFLLPFPDYDELAADIPMYKRYGVVGFFGEGDYEPGGGAAGADMRSWVMARYLWNVNQDMDALVKEWCQGVYGKAWRPMWDYYQLMQSEVRKPPRGKGSHLFIYDDYDAPYLSEATLRKARGYFHWAKRLARNNPTALYYIRKNELAIRYWDLLINPPEFALRGKRYGVAPEAKAKAEAFLQDLKAFGIEYLHEGRPLSWDEQFFKLRYGNWPVEYLENAKLKAVIIPALGGRLFLLEEKLSGHQVMVVQNRDIHHLLRYDFGGYEEYSQQPFHSPGYSEVYTVKRPSSSEVVLEATLANGLKLTRTYRLLDDEAALQITSVLENTTDSPITCGLRTHPEFQLGRPKDCVMHLALKSGKVVTFPLNDGSNQGHYFGAKEYPFGGKFSLVNPKLGLELEDEFTPSEVEFCYVDWDRPPARENLELWSWQRPLAPHASRTFTHTLRLRETKG